MSAVDFLTAFREEGIVPDPNKSPEPGKLPILFVAPLGSVVPDDGVLNYLTLDTAVQFFTAASLDKTDVVLVREDQAQLLRAICENSAVFGIEIKTLYGVPESDYKVWFDEATFGTDRISYSPFVSELRIAHDVVDMQERSREKSVIEREESTFVRKTGLVKGLKKTDIQVGLDDGDDGLEGEDPIDG